MLRSQIKPTLHRNRSRELIETAEQVETQGRRGIELTLMVNDSEGCWARGLEVRLLQISWPMQCKPPGQYQTCRTRGSDGCEYRGGQGLVC